MGFAKFKVLQRRSQFIDKAGIAQERSSIGKRAMGFCAKKKIGALRKSQPRQLKILNLLFLDRSMQNIKHKVDAIMTQVLKLKNIENWGSASQGGVLSPQALAGARSLCPKKAGVRAWVRG